MRLVPRGARIETHEPFVRGAVGRAFSDSCASGEMTWPRSGQAHAQMQGQIGRQPFSEKFERAGIRIRVAAHHLGRDCGAEQPITVMPMMSGMLIFAGAHIGYWKYFGAPWPAFLNSRLDDAARRSARRA